MTAEDNKSVDLRILDPELNTGYLPQPIPSARDDEIGELLLRHLSDRSLARLVSSIDDGRATVLRAYAERMATHAIRRTNAEHLRLGLVALLLSGSVPETRESIAIIPLFYDALRRLGMDPIAFIETVRRLAGDRLVMPLVQFMQRSDKSLEAMGYTASSDADGFRYVRNW